MTLLLESHEALELIEKLNHLLRVPSWHHDHLDDGESCLDLVIIYPGNTVGFPDDLASTIRQYFEDKLKE